MRNLVLAALIALPVVATAQDVGEADAATFAQQRAQVEADLADGETYADISAEDRARVIRALDTIEKALRGRPVGDLRGMARSEVMNAQALINNILTRAGDEDRLVCKREPRAGSRLLETQCLTVAQRRKAAERAQDELRGGSQVDN